MKLWLQIVAFSVLLFSSSTQRIFAQVDNPEEAELAIALERALEALDEAHRQNHAVLLDVLDKVPASARPGIVRAIEASQRGRQNARNQLQTLRERRVGKGKGKPDGIGRGRGQGERGGVDPAKEKGAPVGSRGKGKGKPAGVGKGKPDAGGTRVQGGGRGGTKGGPARRGGGQGKGKGRK